MLFLDLGEDRAELLGERVLAAVRSPTMVGGERIDLTISIGAAVYDGGLETAESLLQQADVAMYEAKAVGGDAFRVHHPHMSTAAVERFQMRNDLRDAFEGGALDLHYQPLVRLSDGQVVGAEALLRWNDGARGTMPPAAFVRVAEESGLIVPIGAWVVREACRQSRIWREAGLPPLRMAVNVSVRQFVNGDILNDVIEALRESGLDSHRLEIEITEGIVLSDSARVRGVLISLAGMGVRIAVDDFGAGYSSFTSISELPIQTLKVDRCFVGRMSEIPESRAITRTIVDLGHHLHLVTIAEGVETAEQLTLLKKMRCTEAQGFLFSPAVPADEFPAVMRRLHADAAEERELV